MGTTKSSTIAAIAIVLVPLLTPLQLVADSSSSVSTDLNATTGVAPVSLQEQLAGTEYGDTGEMILQFYLRDILLTDGLFALVANSEIYLPLSELVLLLDLPILVDHEAGRASGWVFEPDNSFELDVAERKVLASGKEFAFAADSILQDEFDLYISIDDLQKWFPFKLDFFISSQTVVLRSSEALPAELAREREQRSISSETVFAAGELYTVPSYRLIDWPAVNFNVGGFGSSQSETPGYDYSVVASGDLAFMNGRVSASGTDQQLQSLRLTLGRADPSGLLGPLSLADYEFGDTSQFLPGLIGNSLSGRGIRLGNRKLSARRNFDTLDLNGLLQPDYEVELYVNDRLIDVFRDSSDGLYQFNEVPLRLGQNNLRLEFYGPQGQRQTETSRYVVGEGQNRPGQFTYEFAALQPGRLLFENINDDVQARATSLPVNQLSSALDVSYGLTTRSTIGVTVAHLADSRQTEDTTLESSIRSNLTYIDTRLDTSLSGLYVSYNLAVDDQLSLASGLGLRTRGRSREYAIDYIEYGDEYRRFGDLPAESLESLPKRQLSATVTSDFARRPSGVSYSWAATGDYSRTREGQENAGLSARLDASSRYVGGSWVHRVSQNLESGSNSNSGSVGFFLRPGIRSAWSYRAEFDYLDPAPSIVQDATFGAYRSIASKGSLSLQLNRSLDEGVNRYSASWQRQFKHFRFTSTLGGSSAEDLSFRLGANFSVGRLPGELLPQVRSGSSLSSPRIAVLVFVDDNNNLIHDTDEEVVEGVPITRNGLLTDAITNKKGYATVSGLSQRTSVDIGIVSSGVRNPELRLAKAKAGILPRPGRLPIVQIPLVRVRDIEGTVTIDGSTPAPNVVMTLIPETGDGDPLEIRTEFDGVYFLADVPLGKYQLAPQHDLLQTLDLAASPQWISVHVTKDSTLLSGMDFELRRNRPVAAAALPGSAATVDPVLSPVGNRMIAMGEAGVPAEVSFSETIVVDKKPVPD